jgi:predicted nucleic acid-binding Zn ribbon protein
MENLHEFWKNCNREFRRLKVIYKHDKCPMCGELIDPARTEQLMRDLRQKIIDKDGKKPYDFMLLHEIDDLLKNGN